MKKLLFILTCVILTSCFQRARFPAYVIEVSKSNWASGNSCIYFVKSVDKGRRGSFIDMCGKYTVGDTVKTFK